jgi:hypothetical protein
MKRLSAILVAILFVTGALMIPSLHRAHCADGHAAQEAGSCTICQTAHTPLQLSAIVLVPVDTVCLVDTLIPAAPLLPQFSLRTATQARAPPA